MCLNISSELLEPRVKGIEPACRKVVNGRCYRPLFRRGIRLECTGGAFGVELCCAPHAGELIAAESEGKMICDGALDCAGQIAVIDEKGLRIVGEFQRRTADVRKNASAPFLAAYGGDVVEREAQRLGIDCAR